MNPETLEAWRELVAHAEKWAGGSRWVGGEVVQAPPLRPELVAGAAAAGGLRAIAYRSRAEEAVMRQHFARAYEAQVAGGAA